MCVPLCTVVFKVGTCKPGYAELPARVRRVERPIQRRVPECAVPNEICVGGHLVDRNDAPGQISHVPPLLAPRLAYARTYAGDTLLTLL